MYMLECLPEGAKTPMHVPRIPFFDTDDLAFIMQIISIAYLLYQPLI